jgi:hypothetical protein
MQARALKHERLERACRSTIPVLKRVHGGEMVMQRERLHERVVVLKFTLSREGQAFERFLARTPTLDPTVRG